MQFIGIREKLLVAFLGVTSIVLLASGGVFFYIAQGLLKDQLYNRLVQAAISTSTQIGDRLKSLEEIIGEAGSDIDLRRELAAINDGGNVDAGNVLVPTLEDAREASSEIIDVSLFSPDGGFLASARHNPVIDSISGTFNSAIRRQHVSWQWQVHSRPGLELGYSLTYQGRVVGAMVAVIDPSSVRRLLSGLENEDDLFDIIVSRPSENNTPVAIVTSRDTDIEKPDLRLNPFINGGALRYVEGEKDFRGKEVLAILTMVRDYPLGVIVKAEESAVLAPLKEEQLTFFLLIAGSFALALLVTYILSAFLSRPILDMARVASLIASGDFEKRISNFSRDELGLLAKALNQMGERLLNMKTALQTYVDEKAENMERLNDDLRESNEELQELSRTDPLTGLANRREFDAILKREWGRARRNGTALSMCMIDVDYFKRYNDSLGHDAGDEVLKQVAGVIGGQCRRPADLAVRLGGEEFGALLPDTGPEQAAERAEAMRRSLAEAKIPHPDSDAAACLTVSIGVVALVPEGDDPAVLIRSADQALYAAKEAGRNRVIAADV